MRAKGLLRRKTLNVSVIVELLEQPKVNVQKNNKKAA